MITKDEALGLLDELLDAAHEEAAAGLTAACRQAASHMIAELQRDILAVQRDERLPWMGD